MAKLSPVCAFFALAALATAQQYRASALVGSFPLGPIPAAQVSVGPVDGVAADSAGNIYFGSALGCVLKLDTAGNVTRVAGSCGETDATSGPLSLFIATPTGLALDSSGNLYIVEGLGSCALRKLSTDGTIRNIVSGGCASTATARDGTVPKQFGALGAVAVDSAGNVYVAENTLVRKIASNGIITTLATAPDRPSALALDSSGAVYFAAGGQILKVDLSGTVSTFAGGTTTSADTGDGGPALNATFLLINGLAFDASGNLIVGDGSIRSISPSGIVRTIASYNQVAGQIYRPYGSGEIAVDPSGNIYAGILYGNVLRRITPSGTVSTAAGNDNGSYTGDGGPSTSAVLSLTEDVAVDAAGNVFVADFGASRVRKIAPDGTITTVAGNGTSGFSGDGGPAIRAQLAGPTGLALDHSGNLFISEYLNNRVRKVSPDGTITTVAGFGGCCAVGDGGPATQAYIPMPHGIAVDSLNNLYIAEWPDSRIRKVTPDGRISTIAGTGTPGLSGDGGPAASAQLNLPWGLAFDASGNLYVADNQNLRLRKIAPDGTITSIATSGIGNPQGIAADSSGNIFTSSGLKITPDGKSSSINGSSASGQSFYYLAGAGVAVDSAGNLFFATGKAVLKMTPLNLPPPPTPIGAIVSGASGQPNIFAPGEIVVIYINGFGPANLTTALPGSTSLPTSLAGTQVLFNGVEAPIVYTSATRISAIVPYNLPFLTDAVLSGVPNLEPALIQIRYGALQSLSSVISIAATSPGIFTLNQNGTGPAAALNQDGSVNSASNPASAGSILTFFATGEGQTSPAGIDGKLAVLPYPKPVSSVSVTVGGLPATVLYAGGAPGQVAGLMQVNVAVPSGLAPNTSAALQLKVGDSVSQTGVTVAVN
jgi:uncharacterized protein (TIGR03437 family)